MTPIVSRIAAEHGDKLDVFTLHVAENPAASARYGISSIPP